MFFARAKDAPEARLRLPDHGRVVTSLDGQVVVECMDNVVERRSPLTVEGAPLLAIVVLVVD